MFISCIFWGKKLIFLHYTKRAETGKKNREPPKKREPRVAKKGSGFSSPQQKKSVFWIRKGCIKKRGEITIINILTRTSGQTFNLRDFSMSFEIHIFAPKQGLNRKIYTPSLENKQTYCLPDSLWKDVYKPLKSKCLTWTYKKTLILLEL